MWGLTGPPTQGELRSLLGRLSSPWLPGTQFKISGCQRNTTPVVRLVLEGFVSNSGTQKNELRRR